MEGYIYNNILLALYICGVKIWQFYKSNLLVDIYFGGLMKRKTKFAFFLIHGGQISSKLKRNN